MIRLIGSLQLLSKPNLIRVFGEVTFTLVAGNCILTNDYSQLYLKDYGIEKKKKDKKKEGRNRET